ncbi:MAG: hypothetical protein JAY99_10085 [Candidatus Thiodiazotropha lotti]|uniref:Uncharacterized protein n=1 Tax=Candidatus Thiodiazotropha endoloripes TaxID=1818881 RepID=A0A1E2US74_9GAMM|nr:hypothetical protein [Candidatus Thiodiazotropha endoloripes]MCG7896969.1 hypothetical protein [Candidatus Thiodiazotropha weberae]MCG7990486.1 hypothetical protein [Candidatus Thiodiazotropha lotti]MCG7901642.1 hypothetical protein [Candidatus Thiodiazotropha weberae]MCG7913876.1 hypothetical protein [Candidatus Thiodiazotropha weberae]MCG7999863.1 hypothetical protein [Candidatus Thiodiazotropha lotti]
MILLPNSRDAWKTDQFNKTLKQELESVDPVSLPLQQNLALSSYVSDEPFSVMVIQSHEETRVVLAKVGIIYSGIEAGCNCADDPTPIETQPEYCEVMLSIDKESAETTITDPPAS